MSTPKPLIRAYVDETGDRGVSAKSSPFFAMAGVAIADEDEHLLRQAVRECKERFQIPPTTALHWQQHAKVYPRRRVVADLLAAVPGVIVNYVVFEKAAIPAASGLHHDQGLFYNYAAWLLMERLLLTANTCWDEPRKIIATFGHVKGVNHRLTEEYFALQKVRERWLPWHLLHGSVRFESAGAYDGLQAADQYAGMLKAAICPDHFDGFEEHHLLKIRGQIRSYRGKRWGAGFKVMATPGSFTNLPWWPSEGL